MVKAKVYRKSYTEQDVQNALDYLHAGHTKNVSLAADTFGVKRGTLRNRWFSYSVPANKSQASRQHLTPTEESTLCEWIVHQSAIGQPLHRKSLLQRVSELLGRKPSKHWYQRFLKRHPHLRLGKPSGLDPKRAQCFNCATVNEYFVELGQVLDERKIPIENMYNMDEKGCQRGGGRHLRAIKYFIPRSRRPHYKLQSANLELVTIIECVCADGTSIEPGFIFAGEKFHPEWFLDEEFTNIRSVSV
jgi:hypothetical protein